MQEKSAADFVRHLDERTVTHSNFGWYLELERLASNLECPFYRIHNDAMEVGAIPRRDVSASQILTALSNFSVPEVGTYHLGETSYSLDIYANSGIPNVTVRLRLTDGWSRYASIIFAGTATDTQQWSNGRFSVAARQEQVLVLVPQVSLVNPGQDTLSENWDTIIEFFRNFPNITGMNAKTKYSGHFDGNYEWKYRKPKWSKLNIHQFDFPDNVDLNMFMTVTEYLSLEASEQSSLHFDHTLRFSDVKKLIKQVSVGIDPISAFQEHFPGVAHIQPKLEIESGNKLSAKAADVAEMLSYKIPMAHMGALEHTQSG